MTAKKFVSLHSHSHFSVGDAIGSPAEHIDYALNTGMDAMALTDHGNMNGYSHQYFHAEKLRKEGVSFKAIAGVEAYYVDSLVDWRRLYDEHRESDVKLKKKMLAESEGTTIIENEAQSKRKVVNPVNFRYHLVLLAKNSEGLKSLFSLVSESYMHGFFRYPRIDLDMLKKHANGNIIATSACVGGYIPNVIYKHQPEDATWDTYAPNDHAIEVIQKELAETVDKFRWALGDENYYLELQFNKLGAQHLANKHILECSRRTGIPLIATTDAHYADPTHWREREIYRLMARSSKFKEAVTTEQLPKTIDELRCELYPKNAEGMWKSYKRYCADYDFYDDVMVKEAIERTYDIAHDQIDDVHPNKSVKLPAIDKLVKHVDATEVLDEDTQAFRELKQLAINGIRRKNLATNQVYVDRLRHELQIIRKLNFSKYFLTYSRIMTILSQHMITGIARGSAAGSLLAYVLGITQIDPIKAGLLFERFLTEHKKGYPDIDSDCADRTEAIDLISKHFGKTNVIPVSNFCQLQLRSLIKDVARLYDIPFTEINKLTTKIENEALSEAKKTPGFDRAQWVLSFEEAEENSATFRDLMVKYPDFEATIKVLFKQLRSISRHAGGVIITDAPENHMPLIKSGGVLQTPWPEGLNFRHLENLGFLKFDILGLGTLRMFEETIRRILQKEGKKYVTFDQIKRWYYENLHPDNNSMDDLNVYKNVYWRGNWAGVFQFVQPPAQTFVSKLKPRSIVDLATATSIFRPGPLSINAHKLYLKNRADPESITYKHPLLEAVLKDTCGLLVFQEQLQLIYHKLAGVPLDRTDEVRKAFTKKDMSKREEAQHMREELRAAFAKGCKETNDIPEYVADSIFDEFDKFVAYSFNASLSFSSEIHTYTKEGDFIKTKHISKMQPGDWVKSRDEKTQTDIFVEVADIHDHGPREVFEFEFENGKRVTCTMDHKFRVKDGRMVPIGQILEEELEVIFDEENCS